jgi:hypothetical protein
MARSLTELVNTTQDQLLPGFVDALLKHDEVTAAFVAAAGVTDRPSITYNRLASVPTPVYADCNTNFTSQNISGSKFTESLLTLAVQFDVCKIGQNLYSSYTDVVGSEVAGALKGLNEKIANDIVQGGNGSTAIKGIETFATNSFAIAGGSVDVGDLDRLIDEVKDKGSRNVFIGAPATVRKVVAELRAESGGMDYQTLAGTALRTPQYMGYNLLKSEFVDSGKLYFVNPETGYRLMFGEKEDQEIGGIFALESLGKSQTQMKELWRVYCHVAGIGLNPQALAVLTGI